MSSFVINPYRFAAAAGGFAYEYLAAYTDATNLTTYTFTGVDFGAADANRHIVVGFTSRSGSNIEVVSATIGGVTATIDAATIVSQNHSALLRANVTSGTSGTVSVTLNTGSSRAAIGVYRIVASGLTVVDADNAFGGASASVTLDTGDGCVIAAAADSGSTMTWTNLTEDNDGVVEFLNYSTASDTSASGSLTVTATSSSAANRLAAAAYA